MDDKDKKAALDFLQYLREIGLMIIDSDEVARQTVRDWAEHRANPPEVEEWAQ